MSNSPVPPASYKVVKATLLSTRPDSTVMIPVLSAFLLSVVASEAYWNYWSELGRYLAVSRQAVFVDGEIWRLWTALFVHGDYGHLLSNSLFFFVFGYFVGGHYGFWIFPGLSFLAGGVINALTILGYPLEMNLVGISGVVYFLGGFWLICYLLVDRRRTIGQRTLRAVGVSLALLFPSTFMPKTSYSAHLFGFILGVLCGWIYFLKNKTRIRSYEVTETITEDPIEIEAPPEQT